MNKRCILLLLVLFPAIVNAQITDCPTDAQEAYREKVLAYSYLLQNSAHRTRIREEAHKIARANRLPAVSASVQSSLTARPNELELELPEIETPLHLSGTPLQYGTGIRVLQPLYLGGELEALQEKALQDLAVAAEEYGLTREQVLYEADRCYWQHIAAREFLELSDAYIQSITELLRVIQARVEADYADPTDLLMARVRLNDADYLRLQAENQYEVTRLELNRLAGLSSADTCLTDSQIPVIGLSENRLGTFRPEWRSEYRIAQIRKETARVDGTIDMAPFRPRIYLGAEGTFGSPGYDFRPDPDLNGDVFAKIEIPLYEWGKRKHTRQINKERRQMAENETDRIEDEIRLEFETAANTLRKSLEQVSLTENSLQQAEENERRSLERYREGEISILEALDAQIYLQQARRNAVRLEEEIRFLDSYLFLHRVRLGNAFEVHTCLSEDTLRKRIPTLALQIVAENVFKHNRMSEKNPVIIRIGETGEQIFCTNTRQPRTAAESSGIGLTNLDQRCRLICGRSIETICDSGTFTVRIPLLYE